MRIFFTFTQEFVELKVACIRKRLIDLNKKKKQRKKKKQQEYKIDFFEKRISNIFSITRFFIRISNVDCISLCLPEYVLKYPEFWEFASIIFSVYAGGIEISDEDGIKAVLSLNLSFVDFGKEIFRLIMKFLKTKVIRLFS